MCKNNNQKAYMVSILTQNEGEEIKGLSDKLENMNENPKEPRGNHWRTKKSNVRAAAAKGEVSP